MKVTKERLSYLKQAQYVQRLAEPYIRKGKLPLWKIHTKFVIEEAPVSLNTFRKMLKEDVSHLNEKIEIYRKQMEEQRRMSMQESKIAFQLTDKMMYIYEPASRRLKQPK